MSTAKTAKIGDNQNEARVGDTLKSSCGDTAKIEKIVPSFGGTNFFRIFLDKKIRYGKTMCKYQDFDALSPVAYDMRLIEKEWD